MPNGDEVSSRAASKTMKEHYQAKKIAKAGPMAALAHIFSAGQVGGAAAYGAKTSGYLSGNKAKGFLTGSAQRAGAQANVLGGIKRGTSAVRIGKGRKQKIVRTVGTNVLGKRLGESRNQRLMALMGRGAQATMTRGQIVRAAGGLRAASKRGEIGRLAG